MKALIATGLIGLSTLAPTAHADEQDFVTHLSMIGVSTHSGSTSTLTTVGWGVCGELASGVTPANASAEIFYNSNLSPGGISREQADQIVALALVDLCPSLLDTGTVTA